MNVGTVITTRTALCFERASCTCRILPARIATDDNIGYSRNDIGCFDPTGVCSYFNAFCKSFTRMISMLFLGKGGVGWLGQLLTYGTILQPSSNIQPEWDAFCHMSILRGKRNPFDLPIRYKISQRKPRGGEIHISDLLPCSLPGSNDVGDISVIDSNVCLTCWITVGK